ncbi:MAG: DUF1573 domain-containing protein [Flavobacteriaceae bacterium]|nr:DUF1573 domain-containing protein [Flavobacteriaceae bacterium]|tara:strand:- start:3227 stop:3610 length:384 start_codon:yes stop_codon:yes gene_type:complete
MKKIIFSILFLSLYQVYAQTGPEITFESETIDYGEVAQNSDGSRVFKFTNTGDAPLVIKNAKSSCGCTVPKKPEGPIAPGESGEIVVRYDTKNRVGQFRKTITLTTNIENQPMVALKIKGNVLPKKD